MENIDKIRLVCHKVLANPNLISRNGITYCNIGAVLILRELGWGEYFMDSSTKEPFLANDIYNVLVNNFRKVKIEDCINEIDKGIYIASCFKKPHGHVAIVYPVNISYYSVSFNQRVPYVANIGEINAVMPLSYAFKVKDEPKIFYIGEPK